MSLWPHQQTALNRIDELDKQGVKRVCVASPTGSGKSMMMFELAKQEVAAGRKVAIYTDRCLLFDQIADGLSKAGISYGLIASGKRPAKLSNVQLCMVQTATSRVLKGADEVFPADRIIIDEAHKNGGDSMMQLVDRHQAAVPDARVNGFTATPLGIGHAYDELVTAAEVSKLRAAGILVPAHHYGPDEPDQKWIGKVKIDGGECGIDTKKRSQYAQRVFGSVVENYRRLNPDQRPTILFAPGVAESLWFAENLSDQGIPSAHIDGSMCWVDGIAYKNDPEIRADILKRLEIGEIQVVTNRFVLREGIDVRIVSHGIFATVFGSLTSYLQAGGRFLRSAPGTGKERCTIQDHGGNWHRFGSLNADRDWELGDDDRTFAGMREQRLRDKQESEPIVCQECHIVRMSGPRCLVCGHQASNKTRKVLQADGSLREAKGDIYPARRVAKATPNLEKEWASRVRAVQNSKKPSVRSMTFNQLEVSFARDHNWQYPPRTLPMMPINARSWFDPVVDVPVSELSR